MNLQNMMMQARKMQKDIEKTKVNLKVKTMRVILSLLLLLLVEMES